MYAHQTSAIQLTAFDVQALPTLQAIAKITGEGAVATAAAIAEEVGRDVDNTRKTLKVFETAGRIVRHDMGDRQVAHDLTDDGRAVLAAWARAHAVTPDGDAAGAATPGAELPLSLIDADPDLNPRKAFDPDQLADLAAGIRDKGVIQPILVRPSTLVDGRFSVVAGERRRQAAILAGLDAIPALVRPLTDAQALEVALMENIQRADMSEWEEAQAFDRIITARRAEDPGLSLKDAKQAIADAQGKTVRFVELRLQLLDLPPAKRQALEAGDISVTDARKFLQSRPKLADLTARQWLIALEVLDAQVRSPLPKDYAYEADRTLMAPAGVDDPDIAVLAGKTILGEPAELWGDDGYLTGRFAIRVTTAGVEQLSMRFGGDMAEDDLRAKALDLIRAESRETWIGGRYVMPWLNGDFDATPERAAELQAQRDKAAADEAEKERQAKAEADAQARVAREAAARLRLAGDLLWAMDATPTIHVCDPELSEALAAGGKPLPWRPTGRGGIVAANGEPVIHDWDSAPPADVLIRVGVMAVGANRLMGLPTMDGHLRLEAAPEPEPEPAADDLVEA